MNNTGNNTDRAQQSSKPVLVDDIFERLKEHVKKENPGYPRDIINKIIKHREYTTERLLSIVDEFFTRPMRDMTNEQWTESMTAFFILSKFREKRAFEYIVRLCNIPHHTKEFALSDVATENVPEFLASTFNGDWEALYSLVTNQHLDEYLRSGIIDTYGILYIHNLMSREQIINTFSGLFDELYDDYSIVPSMLVSKCCEIHATELADKMKWYFEKQVTDIDLVSYQEMEESFALSRSEAFEKMKKDSVFGFTDNLEEDMKWVF